MALLWVFFFCLGKEPSEQLLSSPKYGEDDFIMTFAKCHEMCRDHEKAGPVWQKQSSPLQTGSLFHRTPTHPVPT